TLSLRGSANRSWMRWTTSSARLNWADGLFVWQSVQPAPWRRRLPHLSNRLMEFVSHGRRSEPQRNGLDRLHVRKSAARLAGSAFRSGHRALTADRGFASPSLAA